MQTLQQSMDDFVRAYADSHDGEQVEAAGQCLEMLAVYLLHYSDLFQDGEPMDESELAEWEQGLDRHMTELLEGDVEPACDLGGLPLDTLDPEHLRDFLGWFVVRETSDSELVEMFLNVLRGWVDHVHHHGGWPGGQYVTFTEVLTEVGDESLRVARLSRVLLHFVRVGGGMSPRLRGKRFSRFVEGHGRVVAMDAQSITLDFDSQGELVGPLNLPTALLDLIDHGDVFDIELGLRGDSWVIVDVGPVYPACVYVEIEAFEGLEKLS